MNYQVLARKWRPSKFAEVVGQDHVVKSLLNALQHDRLHHAYLFTGTRGVGKTTIARILAKAINCENPQQFDPCGKCQVCLALSEGSFMDLIEVDAASRTKVEDTRDLLDNVQYAPSQGRYKVYLIDEVHMLSGHSFNALLKTLEEPPSHVKFLLATTDPQKIPVTVLSRCLQFNLKRLSPEQIFVQMQAILGQEKLSAEPQALKMIARAADGSMRDALSLLDQAIVFGAGQISTEDVSGMLGLIAQQSVNALMVALVAQDGKTILELIDEIANTQSDFSVVLEQILYILHRTAISQQVSGILDYEFDAELISALAQQLTPEDIQLFYQIALLGQKDLEIAPSSRMGFEMVMLRMLAFKPTSPNEVTPKKIDRVNPKQPATTIIPQAEVPVHVSYEQSAPVIADIRESQLSLGDADWGELIANMKLEGLLKEFANNCALESLNDRECRLLLDVGHRHLLNSAREQKLQKILQAYFSAPIKLIVTVSNTNNGHTPAAQLAKSKEERQQAAINAINADATVQALQEHFDAQLIPGSIAPL
jgi:DNA polymerase III subunit gamma/tau